MAGLGQSASVKHTPAFSAFHLVSLYSVLFLCFFLESYSELSGFAGFRCQPLCFPVILGRLAGDSTWMFMFP